MQCGHSLEHCVFGRRKAPIAPAAFQYTIPHSGYLPSILDRAAVNPLLPATDRVTKEPADGPSATGPPQIVEGEG